MNLYHLEKKNEVCTATPESMTILYGSSVRHCLELEDDFTEKEWTIFTKRYENGYDLQGDDRYNLWLSQYHSQSLQSKSRVCYTNSESACEVSAD